MPLCQGPCLWRTRLPFCLLYPRVEHWFWVLAKRPVPWRMPLKRCGQRMRLCRGWLSLDMVIRPNALMALSHD